MTQWLDFVTPGVVLGLNVAPVHSRGILDSCVLWRNWLLGPSWRMEPERRRLRFIVSNLCRKERVAGQSGVQPEVSMYGWNLQGNGPNDLLNFDD